MGLRKTICSPIYGQRTAMVGTYVLSPAIRKYTQYIYIAGCQNNKLIFKHKKPNLYKLIKNKFWNFGSRGLLWKVGGLRPPAGIPWPPAGKRLVKNSFRPEKSRLKILGGLKFSLGKRILLEGGGIF